MVKKSCVDGLAGTAEAPQIPDVIAAVPKGVSLVPDSDIAVDHVPFLGEALVERRARPC
jgi:hypothetical protein